MFQIEMKGKTLKVRSTVYGKKCGLKQLGESEEGGAAAELRPKSEKP